MNCHDHCKIYGVHDFHVDMCLDWQVSDCPKWSCSSWSRNRRGENGASSSHSMAVLLAWWAQFYLVISISFGEVNFIWWAQSYLVSLILFGELNFIWWAQFYLVSLILFGELNFIRWAQFDLVSLFYLVSSILFDELNFIWWAQFHLVSSILFGDWLNGKSSITDGDPNGELVMVLPSLKLNSVFFSVELVFWVKCVTPRNKIKNYIYNILFFLLSALSKWWSKRAAGGLNEVKWSEMELDWMMSYLWRPFQEWGEYSESQI